MNISTFKEKPTNYKKPNTLDAWGVNVFIRNNTLNITLIAQGNRVCEQSSQMSAENSLHSAEISAATGFGFLGIFYALATCNQTQSIHRNVPLMKFQCFITWNFNSSVSSSSFEALPLGTSGNSCSEALSSLKISAVVQ
ncbi:hypothetical protein T4B_3331 [Trichinella pseudospiralis]|uniref:Uncharacterized protein n=1 Tax=Trichinella pseudospiralis TaxID=6337 RepID=A0A0V1EEQ4_TRIPS|nr:hypothetical protein T4A_13665 [Trichinella pseudospiralis]KRZ31241.1 hypothetical protein T4B_3331 [Trichinella pseudospiralis]KRZ37023.1 hypothetical protein T4C_3577 [Trichinella pseudospiralis]